jgi:hypothetical protein
MCFVVARRIDKTSYSLAFPTQIGVELVNLKKLLYELVGANIELITISKPSAYGEYAPYKIIEDKDEFIEAVIKMGELTSGEEVAACTFIKN